MNSSADQNKRRIGIVINYLSLILFICLFYVGISIGFSVYLVLIEILLFAAGLISYVPVYVKTKLWKQVHVPLKNLDEREIQVVYNALKYSYGIFAITVLAIMLLMSVDLIIPERNLILIVNGLLYFAHTLPAAIIGWTETEV